MASKLQWENPSFFKVMLGDFQTTLRIPPLFNKHLQHKNPNAATLQSALRGPGGRQWTVEIAREGGGDGNWFFKEGWGAFVSHLSISLGDFLVFIFDGDSGFNIKVYGKSGCEKGEPLPETLAMAPSNTNKEVGSGSPGEKLIDPIIVDEDDDPKPAKKQKKMVIVPETGNLCYKVLTGERSRVDNVRALQAAAAFKCSNPHYIATCRKSRRREMTVPATLVKKYALAKKDSLVIRDPMGILWPVKVVQRCDGHVCLSTGWSDCYRGNSLKEGDVCVFEFIKQGKEIQVHFFRVEECNPQSGKKAGESIKLSGKRTISNKERVLKAVNAFKTKHPKFVSVLPPSYQHYFTIPNQLVKELNLRKDQRTVIHDPCGRTWPVNIVFRLNGRVDLGPGWSKFSKVNSLCVGDACLFEFIQGADAIRVHIFRA